MDCITFNKDISGYLNGELDDGELNEFLCHLRECKACANDLEINFIVSEGLKILDRENPNYDLLEMYRDNIRRNNERVMARKLIMRFSYVVLTLSFWSVIASAIVFVAVN